ncbi:MAG: type II toxin-antitoxin system VapC family toxin [Geminicoccaceae bacterium]
MLVVDASVATKWFIVEPGRPEARRLLDGSHPLVAPELILAEVVNVVWKRLMAGAIDRSQAADVPRQLPQLFAELCPLATLAQRALMIAEELRHPAYDCFYLALAEAKDARLVTADRRFARRLAGTRWQTRTTTLWS